MNVLFNASAAGQLRVMWSAQKSNRPPEESSMSDTPHPPRGGDITLRPDRPRGLPFLKPLYGPPPYQYTDDVVLIVTYEADPAAVREVLPRELEPLPGNAVAL